MTLKSGSLTIIAVACIVFMMSCSSSSNPATGEGGEESGTQLALDETYDTVRLGVRLVISYNAANSMFEGTIENTANATIDQVRLKFTFLTG